MVNIIYTLLLILINFVLSIIQEQQCEHIINIMSVIHSLILLPLSEMWSCNVVFVIDIHASFTFFRIESIYLFVTVVQIHPCMYTPNHNIRTKRIGNTQYNRFLRVHIYTHASAFVLIMGRSNRTLLLKRQT